MRLPLISIFFCFFFFTAISVIGNNSEHKSARDTATAVVIYNAEARFLPQEDFKPIDYTRMIDSVVMLDTVPVHLINQLSIYRILADKSAEELQMVIDRIFDVDDVPQPVVTAVKVYMTTMEEARAQPRGFYADVPESKCPSPPDGFYRERNSEGPNPDRSNVSRFDSTRT